MANIVETAVKAKQFTTLVKALQAANLVDTLSSPGPYTVFAPNDKAFDGIPADDLNRWLENPKQLQMILKDHVVSGRLMSSDIARKTTINTLQGEDLGISTKNGVMIGNANILQSDIECSNGVIHVIDKVLMPAAVLAT